MGVVSTGIEWKLKKTTLILQLTSLLSVVALFRACHCSINLIYFLAISSVGSPYWCEDSLSLAKFMFSLRSVLRSSYAVCLVTVPGHILEVSCLLLHSLFPDSSQDRSKSFLFPLVKAIHGLCQNLRCSLVVRGGGCVDFVTFTLHNTPQRLYTINDNCSHSVEYWCSCEIF